MTSSLQILQIIISNFFCLSHNMSSIVLLLFLCLSIHACNARLLGLVDKQSGSKSYHSVEDVAKVLSETSKSSMMPTISVEYQAQQINAETFSHESIPKALLRKQGHANGPASGYDIITLSSQVEQKKLIKMQGLKRQARTLLGSATYNMEEDKDSKEDEAIEDVGVMDYAQPHRKPPIHNRKS